MNALAIAPRATVASVTSYLGRRKKGRSESQTEATKSKVDGESEPGAESLCHKGDTALESEIKWSPEENSESSDEDYEELRKRAQRKIRKRRRRVECQTKKSAKSNRIEASLPLDSDDEYDILARKVWKKREENREKRGEQKKAQTKTRKHVSVSSDKEDYRLTSGVLEEDKKGDRMMSSDEEELQSDGEFDVAGKDGRGDSTNHE